MVAGNEAVAGDAAAIPEAATAPTPRMTWDSTAPELDAFGNETVPIFNSTYSHSQ
jgi:hypothetical protein